MDRRARMTAAMIAIGRDVIAGIGLAYAVAGVDQISRPAAMIIGGLIVAGLCVWSARQG